MTNTVNRIRLALVLALVTGVLAGTIGLFGSGGPPLVSAQTDATAPTISSIAIISDPDENDADLEVWPESHWPSFALRQADVTQSYTAW